jgi:hypothetical protein
LVISAYDNILTTGQIQLIKRINYQLNTLRTISISRKETESSQLLMIPASLSWLSSLKETEPNPIYFFLW